MSLPLNSVSWTLGSVALGVFGFRCYRNYQATRNPIAGSGAYIGLFICIAWFWFGVPVFFTRDPQILLVTYCINTTFIQLSYLAQAYLLWFLGLRSRVRLSVVMAVVAIWATINMIIEIMSSRVVVTGGLIPVQFIDTYPLAIVKSILYVGVSVPIGFLFIRLASKENVLKSKLRSIAIGLAFISVSCSKAWGNITAQGRDSVLTATVDIVMFSVLLIALLAPSVWNKLRKQPAVATRQ
jgi:hypothetical protein